jgi:hypothetical protein
LVEPLEELVPLISSENDDWLDEGERTMDDDELKALEAPAVVVVIEPSKCSDELWDKPVVGKESIGVWLGAD